MDITTKSESELKALAYDQLRERDRINQNLAVIEQELARRATPPTSNPRSGRTNRTR